MKIRSAVLFDVAALTEINADALGYAFSLTKIT